jgi:hypothetical protein
MYTLFAKSLLLQVAIDGFGNINFAIELEIVAATSPFEFWCGRQGNGDRIDIHN